MDFNTFVNENFWELKQIDLENSNFLLNGTNNFMLPTSRRKLMRLLKSGFNKTYADKEYLGWKQFFQIPYDTMADQVKRIICDLKKDFIIIAPKVNTTKRIGRGIYDNKHMTALAVLPCDLRNYLTHDTMIDFDMKNAHPTIMLKICEKMGLEEHEYRSIKYYVENRDAVIREGIKKHYAFNDEEIDRMNKDEYSTYKDAIKTLIIRIGYGGSYQYWCKTEGFKYEPVEAIKKYGYEMKEITEKYIIPHNEEYYAKLDTDYKRACSNKKEKYDKDKTRRTICSNFLQHYECLITTTIMSMLIQQNKISNNKISYEYDGFEVTIADATEHNITAPYITDKCKELTGFDLLWEVKPKTDTLTPQIEMLEKEQTAEIDIPEEYRRDFNSTYFKELKNQGYESQKKYFEHFVKFAERPQPLWYVIEELERVNKEGKPYFVRSITHFDEAQLRKLYGRYSTNDVDRNGNEKKFLDKYLDDEDRAVFKQLSFTPYNAKKDPITNTNYLNTFMGYNKIVFEEVNDQRADEDIVKPFITMATEVCGGQKGFETFINLMAFKIKYPTKQLPYAVILQSLQGEGKNLMLDCFGRVIGREHYLSTSNIDDIMGTHAEGLYHKLIVNLNEMDFKSTKGLNNRFKSIITEDTITFNPKNVRPFETENYAFVIITSNEGLPIMLDITTGERRWFIMEGTGVNIKKYTKEQWGKLATYFSKPRFTQALYNYLMNIDCENYNFLQAKRENANSRAYKKIASYSVPMEFQFLRDYIQYNAFECDRELFLDEEEKVEMNKYFFGFNEDYPSVDYDKLDSFKQEVHIKFESMRKTFNDWAKHNQWRQVAEERNSKAFKNKIANGLRLKCMKTDTLNSKAGIFVFEPRQLVREMYERNCIDLVGDEEWLVDNQENVVVESGEFELMDI